MTAYYLRKLIRDNQSQLIYCDRLSASVQETQQHFLKAVHLRLRNISCPGLLEKLVTVHKALDGSDRKNISQLQDVECQIYGLLGFQKIEEIGSKKASELDPDNRLPGEYTSLSFLVSQTLKKSKFGIDFRVTLNYIYAAYPIVKLIRANRQDFELANHSEKDEEICPRYNPRWAYIFAKTGLSALQRQAEPIASETVSIPSVMDESHPRDITWQDFRRIVTRAARISNNPTPRRARDLVKLLNAVRMASIEFMGTLRTRYYLMASRPQDEWCHTFVISESGSMAYCGSILEIVTNTRLKQFEVWMQKFWQLCEAKRDDLCLDLA